jgi:hypothetical protein
MSIKKIERIQLLKKLIPKIKVRPTSIKEYQTILKVEFKEKFPLSYIASVIGDKDHEELDEKFSREIEYHDRDNRR